MAIEVKEKQVRAGLGNQGKELFQGGEGDRLDQRLLLGPVQTLQLFCSSFFGSAGEWSGGTLTPSRMGLKQ